MSQSTSTRNTGIYKKFKTLNNEPQNHSISQWDTYSRNNKNNQSSFRKKAMEQEREDDGGWIGSESTPPRAQQMMQNSYTNQSFQMKGVYREQFTPKSNVSNQQSVKTPTQLIQGILKGLNTTGKLTSTNPYYSEQSEQKLTQILTNQNKLQSFISELESQISQQQLQPQILKNYEMLTILLKHISKSDVEIKHSTKGLQLNFNKNVLIKQENQIERLEKKIKEKDEHIKEIIEEYQSVIRNFNDVIEKLVEERITVKGHHQGQSNGHHGHPHSPNPSQKRNYRQ